MPETRQPTRVNEVLNNGKTPAELILLLAQDKLLIEQQVELWEVFTGFETNNRYDIIASNGECRLQLL